MLHDCGASTEESKPMATADSSASRPPVPENPLRGRHFRLLWIGNTVSWLGDQCYIVALPWIILQLTGSAIALGAIMMFAAAPRAVLMLVGGALTDRISARRILISTASARTVFVGAIGALVWFHTLHIWHLYVLAFAFGVADAFYAPASQVFLPSLVTPEQLPAANSAMQSTLQLATLVGPAPAGLLVKMFGSAWAFFVDAVSFLFVIGALWRLPDPANIGRSAAPQGVARSIAEGLRYVHRDVALRSLLLVIAIINFCLAGPMAVGLAWMAKQKFRSPIAFGVLTSALAAGSLAGMLLAGMRKHQKRGPLVLIVSTVIAITIGMMGFFNHLWMLAAVLVIIGGSAGFLNVQLISWFQQRADRDVLGRVMSVVMFASIGLVPISLAIAGVAVNWSLTGMFVTAGSLMLAVTLLAGLHRPVREID
jgi:MFS family permease